ncbi:unnamed protein product [Bathycoccus prasinos]
MDRIKHYHDLQVGGDTMKKVVSKMEKGFIPMEGAQGWQLEIENAQVLSFAALKSSIEIFEEAGIEALRAKSLKLTSYMESLINGIEGGDLFKIITHKVLLSKKVLN